MKIESIAYEEQYVNRFDPSKIETIDTFLLKNDGKIIRKLNGETTIYSNATKDDFDKLNQEVQEFITSATHTAYFMDNMRVTIVISYVNGTKQIVERGLANEEGYFDSIIEDFLDEYAC